MGQAINRSFGWSKGLLLIALLFAVVVPRAHALTVTAVPDPANVNVSRSTNLSISWRVATTDTILKDEVIFSNTGILRIGGIVVQVINKRIEQTKPRPGVLTLSIREVVRIPASLAQQALASGAAFTYEREFADSLGFDTPTTEVITLVPTGRTQGGLSILRVALSFDDGSLTRVIDQNDTLQAQIRVNFQGSGLLEGAWQIADGTLTGESAFRTIRTVRQHLVAGRAAALVSPVLPSNVTGTTAVRFVMTTPDIGDDSPVIRYFVRLPDAAQIADISLIGPRNGSLLNANQVFAWSPVANAHAYRLEFYLTEENNERRPLQSLPVDGQIRQFGETREGRPVTGLYVPAEKVQTLVSAVTRDRLEAQRNYEWRIVAFDQQGRIIGQSPFGMIVVAQ